MAEAAVVAQLPVLSNSSAVTTTSSSSSSVVELSGAADCPGLLLLLIKDGTMQLWQVAAGQSLWIGKSDAFTAVRNITCSAGCFLGCYILDCAAICTVLVALFGHSVCCQIVDYATLCAITQVVSIHLCLVTITVCYVGMSSLLAN